MIYLLISKVNSFLRCLLSGGWGTSQRQSIHDAIVRRTGYSRCHGGKVCCPDDKIALLKNPQPEDFARSGGEGRYGRIAARSPKKGHRDSLRVLQLLVLFTSILLIR